MSRKKVWAPPGWPWEMELLALIFVITAIAIPLYLQYVQPPAAESLSLVNRANNARMENAGTWQDFTHFFWAVAIVGIYVVHLTMAGASSDWVSTPFIHLFSPFVFSMITYYRLNELGKASVSAVQIVTGKPLEIICWVIGVLLITFLVARIRVSRYLVRFRDVEWDISTPSLFDLTYFELLAYFTPLVYPPRVYKASNEGILIEGWLYVMPLPFDVISSIDKVKQAHLMSSSYCLATSAKSLVRLRFSEHAQPLFISPLNRDAFVKYCEDHLAHKLRGTTAGDTRGGTRTSTRIGTAPGRTKQDTAKPAESSAE